MKNVNIFIALILAAIIIGSASLFNRDIPFTFAEGVGIVDTESIGRDLPSEFEPLPDPLSGVGEEYIEIVDSCGPHFTGSCVRARSGPGESYSVVTQLRNGIVLKTVGEVEGENRKWYKVIFDEPLLYPDRVKGPWYIASDYAEPFLVPPVAPQTGTGTTTKVIYVDRSTQVLSAYEGDKLFMQHAISTGLDPYPTPRGTFTIFKKTPSRYMQGPLPGFNTSDLYDLPGVPWDLYFTYEGAAIHGAYWHDAFGREHSHGCVNLPLPEAKKLYDWADIGTKVIVRD